jgi:hypothetical protein
MEIKIFYKIIFLESINNKMEFIPKIKFNQY